MFEITAAFHLLQQFLLDLHSDPPQRGIPIPGRRHETMAVVPQKRTVVFELLHGFPEHGITPIHRETVQDCRLGHES